MPTVRVHLRHCQRPLDCDCKEEREVDEALLRRGSFQIVDRPATVSLAMSMEQSLEHLRSTSLRTREIRAEEWARMGAGGRMQRVDVWRDVTAPVKVQLAVVRDLSALGMPPTVRVRFLGDFARTQRMLDDAEAIQHEVASWPAPGLFVMRAMQQRFEKLGYEVETVQAAE